MIPSVAFRFTKRQRLLKRAAFLQVQRSGKKLHAKHFIVVVLRRLEQGDASADHSEGRVGITVSKKVGIAVKRNRIKRMVREFVRLNPGWLPGGCDVVVIAKRSAAQLTGLADVTADLGKLDKRLAQC